VTKTIDETGIAGATVAAAPVLPAPPATVQMGTGLGRSIGPPFTDIHNHAGIGVAPFRVRHVNGRNMACRQKHSANIGAGSCREGVTIVHK
jgi:hypothetical protein